jgi:eukaryotic-like serine/threonine-protein kinase
LHYFPVLLILLAMATGLLFWLRGNLTFRKTLERSVAVLPFVNMSSDRSADYFSDGMTEDIITQLSKIREIKVISRNSIMQYKDSKHDLQRIAKQLGVANVLQGSVRKEGDHVRITGQLIDTRTNEHLWGESYDRNVTDLFDVQSEVAKQIANALKAQLTPEEKKRIDKRPTQNMEAYDYYLKGRQYYHRFRKSDNEAAISMFQKALELDPNFAIVYADLAAAYTKRVEFGFPEQENITLAFEAFSHAVSIDPNVAEAYKSLGNIHFQKGELQKAQDSFLKAIQLNPNYAAAMSNTGITFKLLGQPDKAAGWIERSISLEPTNAHSYFVLGEIYLSLDEFKKAEEELKKSLELQPDLAYPRLTLTRLYVFQDNCPGARQMQKELLAINPEDEFTLGHAALTELICGDLSTIAPYYRKAMERGLAWGYLGLGFIHQQEGDSQQAAKYVNQSLKISQESLAKGQDGFLIYYNIAVAHAIKGEKKVAFEWLEKAIDRSAEVYHMMIIDPMLKDLRGEEQFQEVIASAKNRIEQLRMRTAEKRQ